MSERTLVTITVTVEIEHKNESDLYEKSTYLMSELENHANELNFEIDEVETNIL